MRNPIDVCNHVSQIGALLKAKPASQSETLYEEVVSREPPNQLEAPISWNLPQTFVKVATYCEEPSTAEDTSKYLVRLEAADDACALRPDLEVLPTRSHTLAGPWCWMGVGLVLD